MLDLVLAANHRQFFERSQMRLNSPLINIACQGNVVNDVLGESKSSIKAAREDEVQGLAT